MDGGGCCCGSCLFVFRFCCFDASRAISVAIPLVAQVGDDDAEGRGTGRVAYLAMMMMMMMVLLCLSSSCSSSRRQFSLLFRGVQG
jgi:hypothetical protein